MEENPIRDHTNDATLHQEYLAEEYYEDEQERFVQQVLDEAKRKALFQMSAWQDISNQEERYDFFTLAVVADYQNNYYAIVYYFQAYEQTDDYIYEVIDVSNFEEPDAIELSNCGIGFLEEDWQILWFCSSFPDWFDSSVLKANQKIYSLYNDVLMAQSDVRDSSSTIP